MAVSVVAPPRLFVFPGGIDPEVLAVGSEPVPYARTDTFAASVLESERWLLQLLGATGGRLVSYTASGSAAMEAVVSNLVGPEDRVLVISAGTFGKRWVDLVSRYPHATLDVEQPPFGADLDYDRIERRLRQGNYRILLMQHHETSSGALFDVARLGRVCREAGTLLAVDAISSFLSDDFSMDRFGIDAVVLSSHKGLCLPPGLGFVGLGPKALDTSWQQRGLYLDFRANLNSLKRGHPLYTPAVTLYLQLHRRLQLIREQGVAAVIDAVRRKALGFRRLLEADDRTMVAASPSNCLSSFHVRCAARDVVPRLAADGWFIMQSAEPTQVRVAHLGTSTMDDHRELLARIIEIERQVPGARP
jgi:aspartate aminotransferase-like enzyme